MTDKTTQEWQRDNFSNKQILQILSNLKIEEGEGCGGHRLPESITYREGWNEAIEHLEDTFTCLELPHEVFGAMAYNNESSMFEHVGEEPKDAKFIHIEELLKIK